MADTEVKVILPEQSWWTKSVGWLQGLFVAVVIAFVFYSFLWKGRPVEEAAPDVTKAATSIDWVAIMVSVVVIVALASFGYWVLSNKGRRDKTWVIIKDDWWGGLDAPASHGKRFVVITVAVCLAYLEFRVRGSVWAALLFLLFAALVRPPKDKVTLGFLIFELMVVILASFYDGAKETRTQVNRTADIALKKVATKMTKINQDYEKPEAGIFSLFSSETNPAVATQDNSKTARLLVTASEYAFAQMPAGMVLKQGTNCPSGMTMAVLYQGNPTGTEYDCDGQVPASVPYQSADLYIGFKLKHGGNPVPLVLTVVPSV